jgi:large subunit ribosomal protein L4
MLVVDGVFEPKFDLSARNLPRVSLLSVDGLNVYDILRRDTLIVTRSGIKAIEERLA